MSTSTHKLKEKEPILTNCYIMADLKLRSPTNKVIKVRVLTQKTRMQTSCASQKHGSDSMWFHRAYFKQTES